MVVAEKRNVNYSVPEPLHLAFEEMVKGVGGKQKWLVISAALLLLIEADPVVRSYFMQAVAGADIAGDSYDRLMEKAKSGELREEAFRHLPAVRGVVLPTNGTPPPPVNPHPDEAGSGGGRRRGRKG